MPRGRVTDGISGVSGARAIHAKTPYPSKRGNLNDLWFAHCNTQQPTVLIIQPILFSKFLGLWSFPGAERVSRLAGFSVVPLLALEACLVL